MYRTRRAGVLLHPTSLPNEGKLGQLNHEAWRFLDWMSEAGLSVWQMLPLTQPVQGLSPYQSVSAFALNPALLPDDWLTHFDELAFENYLEFSPHWLDDYALFMALRHHFDYQTWSQWPMGYRAREPEVLATFRISHESEILALKKQQFALSKLWLKLKTDANAKGILLFGDMPIFVAFDSADVWANPQEFKLDENFEPTVVAGVPPDYFSETGQRWGNPHYNWDVMLAEQFDWWQKRIAEALAQFDMIRIDHFRGLEACWEIQADEETAVNGHWQKVPGQALLTKLKQSFPDLNVVAEDLGIITPEVVALKEEFDLPGMSVLQFGFNNFPDNPHSLNEQVKNSVVYTGTHDNDTSMGWLNSLDENTKAWVISELNAYSSAGEMPWPLIGAAMASPAETMIAPMQDYLALGSEARMNVPGVCDGNWSWQFDWSDLPSHLSTKIKEMVDEYGRSSETHN